MAGVIVISQNLFRSAADVPRANEGTANDGGRKVKHRFHQIAVGHHDLVPVICCQSLPRLCQRWRVMP